MSKVTQETKDDMGPSVAGPMPGAGVTNTGVTNKGKIFVGLGGVQWGTGNE